MAPVQGCFFWLPSWDEYTDGPWEIRDAWRAAFARFPVADFEFVENLVYGDWSGTLYGFGDGWDRAEVRRHWGYHVCSTRIAFGLVNVLSSDLRSNGRLIKALVWRFTDRGGVSGTLKLNPTPREFIEDKGE